MFKQFLFFTLALVLLASQSFAAVTPNSIIMPQTPNRGIVQFLQGTDVAGTYKTIYTAGANGSIIKSLWATTNDPSASHLVTCQIVNTAVKYGGVAVTVSISSGFATSVPPVNLMTPTNWTGLPLDSDGNPFLAMASGDTLQCTFATSITSTDVINLVATASDF